jgi:hypothetical protein
MTFQALNRPPLQLAMVLLMACTPGPESGESAADTPESPEAVAQALYMDVSGGALPVGDLTGLSMDARAADLDGDGDLDIVIANEHRPNIFLMNDGQGRFANASGRLPRTEHDSEDVGIADFDLDGDLDIVVVTEDDQVNELYLNDGSGQFEDAGDRLPVTGTSNAVLVAELTGDGAPDILIGNNGQDAFLVNDGTGHFLDETATRLPALEDVTQDLELGDVDGDGDLDLLVGNEDRNRLLINDGTGRFSDDSEARIPLREAPEETREADFGDIDGDGDLDILFANVKAFVEGADPANRLLVNDGTGHFTDETGERLPRDQDHSFDGDFLDIDGDGDLDIITANADVDLSQGRIADAPYRVYRNDGSGVFTRVAQGAVLPEGTVGTGFDVEFVDLNGDGLPDLYLASRGSGDRLLLRR